MASCGLLDSLSEDNEEEVGDCAAPDREVLLQLARRAQLWPALEELAVLNQMKVTTDLLYLSVTPGYDDVSQFLNQIIKGRVGNFRENFANQ